MTTPRVLITSIFLKAGDDVDRYLTSQGMEPVYRPWHGGRTEEELIDLLQRDRRRHRLDRPVHGPGHPGRRSAAGHLPDRRRLRRRGRPGRHDARRHRDHHPRGEPPRRGRLGAGPHPLLRPQGSGEPGGGSAGGLDAPRGDGPGRKDAGGGGARDDRQGGRQAGAGLRDAPPGLRPRPGPAVRRGTGDRLCPAGGSPAAERLRQHPLLPECGHAPPHQRRAARS